MSDHARDKTTLRRDAILGSIGLVMILIGVVTGQREPVDAGIALSFFVCGFLVGKHGR